MTREYFVDTSNQNQLHLGGDPSPDVRDEISHLTSDRCGIPQVVLEKMAREKECLG